MLIKKLRDAISRRLKNLINNQAGFTLIELIMVIVILGILAATAVPKFLDLTGSAINGTGKSTAGALASAAAISFAKDAVINPASPSFPDCVNLILATSVSGIELACGAPVPVPGYGVTGIAGVLLGSISGSANTCRWYYNASSDMDTDPFTVKINGADDDTVVLPPGGVIFSEDTCET